MAEEKDTLSDGFSETGAETAGNGLDDEADAPVADPDSEWDRRILCSDDACIGVIGPDGRCKECGLPYEGTLPDDYSAERPDADLQTEEIDTDESEPWEADEEEAETDPDWIERTLCRDEACIGVIGPDGRCKECGLPYEASESPEPEKDEAGPPAQ